MIRKIDKNVVRQRIHKRVREKVSGTATTPRISLFRSNAHIYVQVIDDVNQVTLAASSTKAKKLVGANVANATEVGADIGAQLKKLKIQSAVFDRSGYQYHGKVKAVADSIRAAGIKF